MKIYNNPTAFCGVRIKNGGIQTLKKEGIIDVDSEINKLREEFKHYNWDLDIGEEGYALTSPTTLKTFYAPFSIKRQYFTASGKDDNSIIIRMGEKNRTRYKINFKFKDDVRRIYSLYQKSSPLEKIKTLLRLLESELTKSSTNIL